MTARGAQTWWWGSWSKALSWSRYGMSANEGYINVNYFIVASSN